MDDLSQDSMEAYVKDNNLEIATENVKSIIYSDLLEEMISDRDRSIERIRLATEIRKRQLAAKNETEYNNIPIPDEFLIFKHEPRSAMHYYVSGYTLADMDGKPRCRYGAMGAPSSVLLPILYRGELCDYGETAGYSSLGRFIRKQSNCKCDENRYIELLVSQMRQFCFHSFLTSFHQYTKFPFGTPLAGIIAQHYGLDTPYLDLTDDIRVALFFASCKHMGNNIYRPIEETDLYELGKYGVLYIGMGNPEHTPIIGYQPFCRCHRQRGFYYDTNIVSPCWKHSIDCDKFYFNRTPELSHRLYEYFDGGKYLFPDDGLSIFEDEIKQIRHMKIFPNVAFDLALEIFNRYIRHYLQDSLADSELLDRFQNKDYILKALKRQGYELCSQLLIYTDKVETIATLNSVWNPIEFAEKEGIEFTPLMVRH